MKSVTPESEVTLRSPPVHPRRRPLTASLSLLAAVGFFAPLPVARAQEPAAPDPCLVDAALSGVWVSEDGASAIRFSGSGGEWSFAVVEQGQLQTVAPVVECGAGFVKICSFGGRHRIDLSRSGEGERLEIHYRTTDIRRTYHRPGPGEEGPLAAFEPRALELPEAGRLPEERVAAIREELAHRVERDQAVRQEPIDSEEMARVDSDNTGWLKELVGEVGWIDPARFGPEAADAAFLIVQHSGDLPLLMASLPHLEAQGRLGEYALMYDRLQLRLGGEQRYGSQVGWTEDGAKGLLPIESLEGIDDRRREMGLGSLDEYLALFEIEGRPVLDCGGEADE